MTLQQPAPVDLEGLRRAVRGTVVAPAESGWDEARRPWHASVDQHPAAVVNVAGRDDVEGALAFAREHGLGVCAQPTGHSASWSLAETLLLRTGVVGGVEINPETQVASVEPGAHWRDVQAAGEEHGLAGLAGTAPHVSTVGFCMSGGLSWMARPHGLAANSVRSFEVVTADGQTVDADADADSEPDLFWALRGGGGNFGIVTGMDVELKPVQTVYAGNLMWPLEHARDVLHRWRAWLETLPEQTTSLAMLLRVPPLPTVPAPLRGQAFVVVAARHEGPESEGAELLAPLREESPPALDTFAAMPPTGLWMVHNDPEDPTPSRQVSELLSGVSDEMLDRLVDSAGVEADAPLLFVELRHLGGAVGRPDEGHGAVGHLDADVLLHAIGIPMSPEWDAPIEASLEQVAAAVEPWTTGRRLLNFIDELPEVPSAWPEETHRRLLEVKRRYDPDGVIRSSHPLEGAA